MLDTLDIHGSISLEHFLTIAEARLPTLSDLPTLSFHLSVWTQLCDACRPCGDGSRHTLCRDNVRTECVQNGNACVMQGRHPLFTLHAQDCIWQDAGSARRVPCLCIAALSHRRVWRPSHIAACRRGGRIGRPPHPPEAPGGSMSGSGGGVSIGGPGRQTEDAEGRVGLAQSLTPAARAARQAEELVAKTQLATWLRSRAYVEQLPNHLDSLL